MFKRASFRRSSNSAVVPPATSAQQPPSSSSTLAASSSSPRSPPASSSLLSRFKPSPKAQNASLTPVLSRANTMPVIDSSTNSSRSSFTSVSTATRQEAAEEEDEGHDVWGQEEEEGRRPLVEIDDNVDDGTPTEERGPAKPATSTLLTNGHQASAARDIGRPLNGYAANGHLPHPGLEHLSTSAPAPSSRPSSPSSPAASPSSPTTPSAAGLVASPTSPGLTTTSTTDAQPAHVHREHTHHHAHHHSPPTAGPPPIRASTLSGLKDVASIAAASLAAKEQAAAAAAANKKKKGGGFMSSLSRKLRDPSLEGALALASLPTTVQPAEELTPQMRMERAKQAERAHLLQICMELGVEIYDIAPDGHCMYAAVADQLAILKVIKEEDNNPRTTRAAAADYMLAHPDAFMPFLVGSADLEFGIEDDGAFEGESDEQRQERRRAVEDGMMTEKGFKRYCERVRESGEWGGEPEILALSRYYQVPIHVIQSNHPKIVAHSPDPKAKATLDPRSARKIKAVRISYHRRLYGLGEHYNSLRKITYSLSAFSAMVPM